jgi:hypothetical protein
MSPRDIALTGVPRGGTTLACRLLGTCEDTVSLFEPMDVMLLPVADRGAAVDAVGEFYLDCRARLANDGVLPSKQRDGEVPDNPFGEQRDASGRRSVMVQPGWIRMEPRPADRGTLVVKHNAAFAALLPELAGRLETIAVVRNPVAVLASWHSVALPVGEGRLPAGERLDPALGAALDAEPDVLARQLHLLDWFFARFDRHLADDAVLRYEDIVASDGDALTARLRLRRTQHTPLSNRNSNPIYRSPGLAHALNALRAREGHWTRWYAPSDIGDAIDALAGEGR